MYIVRELEESRCTCTHKVMYYSACIQTYMYILAMTHHPLHPLVYWHFFFITTTPPGTTINTLESTFCTLDGDIFFGGSSTSEERLKTTSSSSVFFAFLTLHQAYIGNPLSMRSQQCELVFHHHTALHQSID